MPKFLRNALRFLKRKSALALGLGGLGVLSAMPDAAIAQNGSGWNPGPQKSYPNPAEIRKNANRVQPASSTQAADTSWTDSKEKVLRLAYYQAGWARVLNDLAKKTGSQLIMKKVPPGRFSRNDWTKYGRAEAINILNGYLEAKGFRILVQDKFLIVLSLRETRPHYRRPVYYSDAHPKGPRAHGNIGRDINNGAINPRRSTTLQPRHNTAVAPRRELPPRRDVQPSGYDRPTPRGEYVPSNNRPQPFPGVSRKQPHRDPFVARTHNLQPAPKLEPMPMAKPKPAPRKMVSSRFEPRFRSAVDLARAVYKPFQARGRLLDKGPGGFPAFEVFQPKDPKSTAQPKTDFAVGIDTARNLLIIEGPEDRVKAVNRLLTMLDVRQQVGAAEQFVPGDAKMQKIAANLVPLANQLVVNQPGKQPMGMGDPKNPMNPMGPNDPLQGGLQGRVTIRTIPGLGVILTGNEADIKRLIDVINRIEQMSIGRAPEIRLHFLKHVDSTALSTMLKSVYDQLAAFRQPGGVVARPPGQQTNTPADTAFVPVVKPNAIIILAPGAGMKSIVDLIQKLDTPVDPLTEFAVVHLKNAPAETMQTLLTTFYEERGGLGAKARVIADPRTNSLVIQATPRDLQEISAVIGKLDRDYSASVAKMQIIPLRNATAEDLATVINNAIQSVIGQPAAGTGGTGGNSPLVQTAKSVMLQFLAIDAKAGKPIKSGVLTGIRVTADTRSNALVVSAPQKSMGLMKALIDALDQPARNVAEIRVVTLTNADASAVTQLLQTLFSQTTGNQQGVPVLGSGNASGLIPLRFSTDVRTNSIIAIGSKEALGIVEALLFRLDEGDIRQRKQSVYRLKNSPATFVGDAVNQFLTQVRTLSSADPTLINPFQQIEREVIVQAEEVSNSLIISAHPRYYDEIIQIIERLDQAPPQVIIQAMLVEVTLDNVDEFGVELGFQDSILFDRSIVEVLDTISTTTTTPGGNQVTTTDIVASQSTPGFNFNNGQPLGQNVQRPGAVAGQGLSNFGVGRVNSELGFGGLVLSASSENVSILLRALQQEREIRVLSRPQIRTLDNQLGEIQVGQQVPIVNGGSVNANGFFQPQITQDNAGLILSVTPRINSDGIIVMNLVAENSNFELSGVPIFTQTDGSVITSPIKNVTAARATVAVHNNQTVVLGGLITQREDSLTRKVPWLGDVPLLGAAFRYDSVSKRRSELLIFLTPRIVRHDADDEMIKQVEAARLHYSEQEAEAIHGPLFGVPAELPNGTGMPRFENQPGPIGPGLPETTPPAPGPANPEYSRRRTANNGIQPVNYEAAARVREEKRKEEEKRKKRRTLFPQFWKRK